MLDAPLLVMVLGTVATALAVDGWVFAAWLRRGRSPRKQSSGPQADEKYHERHCRVASVDRPE